MKKVVLLTNILSPYRSVFYQCMYERGREKDMDFKVLLMNDTESNRQWKYDEFAGEYSKLLKKKVFFGKKDSLYINVDLEKSLDAIHPDVLAMAGSYTFLPVWQAKKWAKHHPECQLFFWSESHLDEVRDYNRLTYFFRDCIRKNFYSKMNGFWYPGEKAKALIKKYASESAKYIHVPNLIDNRKFAETADRFTDRTEELREKYGLSTSKKLFFSPMRLTKVKGLLPFLELVSEIRNKDNLQIVIAGEGELEEEIRNFAVKKNIDLKLMGYRSGEEVAELLSCTDVFFMPSLSDPSPLSCIEALWCRKPLLVSRHVGNAPEVIVSEENGFVFSYEKPEEARGYIETLIDKQRDWYQIAAKVSGELAEKNFNLVSNTDRIIDEISRV